MTLTLTEEATSRTAFISTNCRSMPVPLVPEISLKLAHEALPLWRRTEEELGEMGLPPPFWAFAWAGGQALARYVLDNSQRVRGKCVIDLASGSGLVAIAAKLAGASSVLAADIDPYAIDAIALNAEANGVNIAATGENLLSTPASNADVILAGDIFYERPLAETALAWLQAARSRGIDVVIGDPGRSYLPHAHLRKLMDYSVPVTRELEDAEIKRTTVWALA